MAETYATDPENVEWIEDYITKSICPQLPKDYVPQCKMFAMLVAENLAIWIRDNVKPADVCRQAGMCIPGQEGNLMHVSMPTFDAKHFIDSMLKQKLAEGNFDPCNYCKETMEYLNMQLTDPEKISKIMAALEKACGVLGDFEDTCMIYVRSYVPMVLQLAAAYIQPQLCIDLGYCERPPALQ